MAAAGLNSAGPHPLIPSPTRKDTRERAYPRRCCAMRSSGEMRLYMIFTSGTHDCPLSFFQERGSRGEVLRRCGFTGLSEKYVCQGWVLCVYPYKTAECQTFFVGLIRYIFMQISRMSFRNPVIPLPQQKKGSSFSPGLRLASTPLSHGHRHFSPQRTSSEPAPAPSPLMMTRIPFPAVNGGSNCKIGH